MNLTRDRIQSIGWAFVLVVCLAVTVALTFRVNAVKSQARLAERQVIALERDKMFLQTEFETRSSQQQLSQLNELDFGYQAPRADQYIEGERQLAVLGKPRGPGAPAPIRVASAAVPAAGAPFPALVAPIATRALAAEVPHPAGGAGDGKAATGAAQTQAASLNQRLVRLPPREAADE
jgi:hypothetical protein